MLATICGAAFKRVFCLTKWCFSLAGEWSWHARLPRSQVQHPSCGSQETKVLNTAHLLMWCHAQPYAAAIYTANTGNSNPYMEFCKVIFDSWVTLLGCFFSGYGLLVASFPGLHAQLHHFQYEKQGEGLEGIITWWVLLLTSCTVASHDRSSGNQTHRTNWTERMNGFQGKKSERERTNPNVSRLNVMSAAACIT